MLPCFFVHMRAVADMLIRLRMFCGHGHKLRAAAPADEIGGIPDARSEHKFDAAHGEDGNELVRPAHFRYDHDEKCFVAGSDEHGKQRT